MKSFIYKGFEVNKFIFGITCAEERLSVAI
jgi:hypothetical protein